MGRGRPAKGRKARIRHGGRDAQRAARHPRFDGTAKPIIASAAPLRALDGQIVGAVLMLRDLTESRRTEEDLAQRVTKLVALGVELEESAAAR